MLFRKGEALQALTGATLAAFDKTGTLTKGAPQIAAIQCVADVTEDALLRIAAAIEAHSEHPLAKAVLNAAAARQIVLPHAIDIEAVPGQGLTGVVDGVRIYIGTSAYLNAQDISCAALIAPEGTALYVAKDGTLCGILRVTDTVKPEAKDIIDALHVRGFGTALLTGDTHTAASEIAAQTGVTEIAASLLPKDKVTTLKAFDKKTIFIGDGINDAPVLAAADVGIALGTGTDIAIESADIVLMSGDLNGVVKAIDISQATMRNIRQNLFWAFGYNVLLIPVAAGALYPFTGLLLSPMLAAGAMALSSVFVVTNALRLRWA